MNHQDFKEIIIRKKQSSKSSTSPHFEVSNTQKIEKDTENLSHQQIGKDFGQKIRDGRLAKGYKTQKDLANILNIDKSIINSYENGSAIPDINILQKIKRTLNIK